MATHLPDMNFGQAYATREALHRAAAAGNLPEVEALCATLDATLDATKSTHISKPSAAETAARSGHLDVVKFLHDATDAFSGGKLALVGADAGHLHIVQWGVGTGIPAHWEEFDKALLFRAAKGGHFNVFQWARRHFVEDPEIRCKFAASCAGECSIPFLAKVLGDFEGDEQPQPDGTKFALADAVKEAYLTADAYDLEEVMRYLRRAWGATPAAYPSIRYMSRRCFLNASALPETRPEPL